MNLTSKFVVVGQKLVMAANIFLNKVTAQHSLQKKKKNRTILGINSEKMTSPKYYTIHQNDKLFINYTS
jgi:LysM repeat protein